MRVATLGREDVHRPGVLVERDADCGGDRLTLADQIVDEVAEIGDVGLGREVGVVGEAREGSDRVDGGVEDELRPLRRPEVGERLGLQAAAADQLGDLLRVGVRRAFGRADPRRRVEDVLAPTCRSGGSRS